MEWIKESNKSQVRVTLSKLSPVEIPELTKVFLILMAMNFKA